MSDKSPDTHSVSTGNDEVKAGPATPGASGAGGPQQGPQVVELPAIKFALIMLVLFMALFIVSLDKTIIGVAIPTITNEFNSIGSIGWYGSAYLLTSASLQLPFGRIYKFNSVKTVFLISVFIFECGSAICGAAPNSTALILGRAIAGGGAAGVMSGCIQIVLTVVPLHKRPMWQALFGLVFGLAAALGPLIGGAFTSKVSWRWNFYVNVPIGAAVMLVVFLFLDVSHIKKGPKLSFLQQIKQLDPLGFFLSVPSIVSLLLALHYGGFTFAWNDGRMIALWVIFAVFLVAFIASQIYAKEGAMLPPHVVTQRSVMGSLWYTFCLASAMMILVYYIPIWFQAIKGSSALTSSYQNLPLVLSLVIASILSGMFGRKTGYYVPQMFCAPVVAAVGAGLMATWTPMTDSSKWIAYQFLAGFGIGLGMQAPSLAIQTCLRGPDVPIGIAANFFVNQIGSAIFVSVGQNILVNKLASGLQGIPGVDAAALSHGGATDIRSMVSSEALPAVIRAYNLALRNVWYAGVAMLCLMVFALPLVEWKSMKKASAEQAAAQKAGTPEEASKPEAGEAKA
ncbi:unnamed protein product [Parajaminaea phylloscopi]